MGGGRPMTAGDRQSETCAHEYVERREEEDVSGISRANESSIFVYGE